MAEAGCVNPTGWLIKGSAEGADRLLLVRTALVEGSIVIFASPGRWTGSD